MAGLTIFNCGCGVQSSAILGMCGLGYLDKPDIIIFADTKAEPKAVYDHLKWCQQFSKEHGMRFEIVTDGNLRTDLRTDLRTAPNRGPGPQGGRIGSIKSPPVFVIGDEPGIGKTWRKCSKEYKIKPIQRMAHQEARKLLPGKRLPPEFVEQWIGYSTDEARRAKRIKTPKYIRTRFPLLELGFSRDLCVAFTKKHGLPEAPKSACVECPLHNDRHWHEMQTHNPHEFDIACDTDEAIRTGLPGLRGKAYIHRSCRPLREIDFAPLAVAEQARADKRKEKHALPLFNEFDECVDGVCGM